MIEYRRRFNIGTSTTQTTPAIATSSLMDQIAMQYGVGDMTNFNTPTIEAPLLGTIDQEFEEYTKAVSLKGTDMIKFWDVSNFFAIFTIKCLLRNLV